MMTLSAGNPAIVVAVILLLAGVIWLVFKGRRGSLSGAPTAGAESLGGNALTIFYVLVPIFLILGLSGILTSSAFSKDAEIQIGFVVVIAISALLALLFIIAAGFSHLHLADEKQPLGLPEGSIRSMIALILIMVFIIFGVFLFRSTGVGYETGPTTVTLEEMLQLKGLSAIQRLDNGTFNVWMRSDYSQDSIRIAQQLITTVGTLVVAVAGFYFGSSSVTTAAAAVRATTSIQPMIMSIDRGEGKQDEELTLTIAGRDFQIPRAVKLVRGTEEILASKVMASGSEIAAHLKLDKPPGGDNWDVVIQNPDGSETRREKVFKITA